jgi:hypothetical protein
MGHRRFLVVTGFETLTTGIFMSAFTLFISVLVEAVSDGGGGR